MEAPEQLSQRLSAITEQVRSLRGRRAQLVKEALQLRDRRDGLNQQGKGLRERLNSARAQLRELGERTGEVRSQMGFQKKALDEARETVGRLAQQLEAKKAEVGVPIGEVRRRLMDLEWRVQTNPTNVELEKRLMREWEQLEAQRVEHEDLERLTAELLEAKAKREALKLSLNSSRESLGKLLEARKRLREEIAEGLEGIQRLQEEADEAHGRYLEKRDEVDRLDSEILAATAEAEKVRGQMAERERALRERKVKEAAEAIRTRMSQGGKITFQELQVLLEYEGGEGAKP